MKLLLYILLFSIGTSTIHAQNAEIIIPVGHNARINKIEFSDDMSLAATGAGERMTDGSVRGSIIKVWDMTTNVEVSTLSRFTEPVSAVRFSQSGRWLAAGSKDGKVVLWDLKNDTELSVFNAGIGLEDVFFTDKDEQLVTVANQISYFSLPFGELVSKIPRGTSVIKAASYHKGTDILVVADAAKVQVYRPGIPPRELELYSLENLALQFNAGGTLFCAGRDIDLSGRITTVIKSVDILGINKEVRHIDNAPKHSSYFLSANGKRLGVRLPNQIIVYSLDQATPDTVITEGKNTITAANLSPGNNNLLYAYEDDKGKQLIQLVDLRSGNKLSTLSGSLAMPWHLSFSSGDSTIIIGFDPSQKNKKAFWNLYNGDIRHIRSDATSNEFTAPLRTYSAGRKTDSLASASLFHKANQSAVKLKASLAGSLLIDFAKDRKHFLTAETTSFSNIKIFRSADLKLLKTIRQLDTIWHAEFMKDGSNFLTTGADKTARIWNIDKEKVLKTFRGHKAAVNTAVFSADESKLATAGYDKTIIVWDVASGSVLQSLKGHTQKIVSLAFSPDARYMVSAAEDFSVRLWNLKYGNELARFYAVDSTDYMITTNEGYYMSTPNAARKLYFKTREGIFSFSQFDLLYNRPDKVLRRIGISPAQTVQLYEKILEKRLSKMGFDPGQFSSSRALSVPEIDVLNRESIPAKTSDRTLKFTVRASDALYHLTALNVFVNGVPVFGRDGLSLRTAKSLKLFREINIQLSFGKNLVEVSASNSNGVESLKTQILVELGGVKPKPNLYLVTIGVSRYKDSGKNLQYAAKDATDIQRVFSENKSAYNNLVSVSLLNEDATKENILAVRQKLSATLEDDHVIVFYAGHGIVANDMEYYLATHGMDFSRPQNNGVSYQELEDILDGIRSRSKILLLDACHSGEIDKDDSKIKKNRFITTGEVTFNSPEKVVEAKLEALEPGIFELMKQMFVDLRISTGAAVIASAGAANYALESNAWNNGAFTYCLKEGLKKNKADMNDDGKIMMSELESFVVKQVDALTEGLQVPVVRMWNHVNDILVWQK